MYKYFIKRVLDVIFSILCLTILLPFFLVISLIIVLDSRGPVLFMQDRLGKNGKVFRIYKFRTMFHSERSNRGEVFIDNPEVTAVGKFLRRFKIDELPQLINILIGDMSVVGPRPGLVGQLPEYDEFGRKRLIVRPGLTGYAQVNGNIFLSWPERWQLDCVYIDNISFITDIRIIFRTLLILLRGEEKFLKRNNDVI